MVSISVHGVVASGTKGVEGWMWHLFFYIGNEKKMEWVYEGSVILLSTTSLALTLVCRQDLEHEHPHTHDEYVLWATSLELNLIMVIVILDLVAALGFLARKVFVETKALRYAHALVRGTVATVASGGWALLVPIHHNLSGIVDDTDRMDGVATAAYTLLVVTFTMRVLIAFALNTKFRFDQVRQNELPISTR